VDKVSVGKEKFTCDTGEQCCTFIMAPKTRSQVLTYSALCIW